MAVTTEEVVANLSESYQRLTPLLEYLRARLKYDTIRWLRTYGTKDDIVFSTRTKTFERVHDKLVRRGITLTKRTNLLDIVLSNRGVLDDLIGIRFICFESFNIFRLISYFLITERVTTSERTFYISHRTNQDAPLYRFLRSNGFTGISKKDREYEDVNFISRFSHPIDQYFGSGLKKFESLAQRTGVTAGTSERLQRVNMLFDQLREHHPTLISAISKFPIECQIVTSTQHIYNRTQRPQYEYVLQRKAGETSVDKGYLEDLSSLLEILKLNLISADQTVYSIHRKSGIQYQLPLQINPGRFFSLDGRLPKNILEKNRGLNLIDDKVPELINPNVETLKRERILAQIFKIIDDLNRAIAQRATEHKDISAHDLLEIADLRDLSHPEIVFWTFQRIVILIICNLLLYTPDPLIVKRIVSKLKFAPTLGDADSYTLEDSDIVIGRLFEKLEHIDHAIHSKLVERTNGDGDITGWKDNYFSESIFSDPLVQWRYASHMYSKREYTNALQELKVGIAVYAELEEWSKRKSHSNFEVPERVLFEKRIVEYELCMEMAALRYAPTTVAGMLEFCNAVVTHSEAWNSKLQSVIDESEDTGERARCLCFQILFRLCEVSTGGLKGNEVGTLQDEFRSRFEDMDKLLSGNGGQVVKEKSWWLLAESVIREGSAQKNLEQVTEHIADVKHHPLERKQFEELCANLIRQWMPTDASVNARSDFSANMLALLSVQSKQISESRALAESLGKQSSELIELVDELQIQLAKKGELSSRESTKAKLGRIAGDAAEQFGIDMLISGLRSILGL